MRKSRSRSAGAARLRIARLAGLARGIVEALPRTIAAAKPLFVILDGDIAQTLGALLKEELGVASEVLALDGIALWDFDYIDLGRVRMPSFTVPVTIKSLVFSEDPRIPHAHHHHATAASHEVTITTTTTTIMRPERRSTRLTAALPSRSGQRGRRDFEWKWVVIGACVAFTVYIAVIPLAFLLWQSFRTPQTAATPAVWTLGNYAAAYGTQRDAAGCSGTSIRFAFGASLFAFLVGTALAWMNERTNTPFKSLFFALSLIPLVIPSILFTVAWILLASPQIGIINLLLQRWFGLEQPPFDIYSLGGMIWVDGLHYSPMAFLLMSAAFRAMDPVARGVGDDERRERLAGGVAHHAQADVAGDLRDDPDPVRARRSNRSRCRRCSGSRSASRCSPRRSTRRCIAIRARSVSHRRTRVALLAITTVGVYAVSRLSGRGSKYATMTGKGFRPRQIDLGAWRWLTAAIFVVYFVLIVVLPFLGAAVVVVPAVLHGAVDGGAAEPDARPVPLHLQLSRPREHGVEQPAAVVRHARRS